MSMNSSTATIARTRTAVEVRFNDYWELTKPRLSLMAVATAILGYFAAGPELQGTLFLGLLVGTTFSAFGAAALNQWMEREADARMRRTADRPVASGRVSPQAALLYGVSLSILGVGLLYSTVNTLAAVLSAATILLYILAYTPLKRLHPIATEVGSIPGAIPPLIGWAAAANGLDPMAWVLFSLLAAWQMPHFMAIAWNCREDYAMGGFQVLSVRDPEGVRVSRNALVWTLILTSVSFLPLIEPGINWVLGSVAAVLAWLMLKPALQFFRSREDRTSSAKRLFFATLIYLPVYLSALVVDRFFL